MSHHGQVIEGVVNKLAKLEFDKRGVERDFLTAMGWCGLPNGRWIHLDRDQELEHEREQALAIARLDYHEKRFPKRVMKGDTAVKVTYPR